METYHSLQVEANRRFTQGLSFQTSYTFSRFIDEDSDNFAHDEPVTVFNIHKNQKGLSLFHTPHRFVSNWIWELPFLRDRPGVAGQVLGGWTFTGIVTLQSGRPFSVFTSAVWGRGGDFNGDGLSNDRPHIKGTTQSARFDNRPGDGILTQDAFAINFRGLWGLGRNTFLGPGFANVDLGIYKHFRLPWLGEEGRLQFRSEFSNAFNRVNFGQTVSDLKGLFQNYLYTLARAPRGQMRGAATQAMPVCIVEERQQSRCPRAAAPLRAAAPRPAGFVARSLHTTSGMLVARASPAGLGAGSKVHR